MTIMSVTRVKDITKPLLFEGCCSNSLHLLPSSNVSSASDRLRGGEQMKEIPWNKHREARAAQPKVTIAELQKGNQRRSAFRDGGVTQLAQFVPLGELVYG